MPTELPKQVCSPVYHDFPPGPTTCFLCKKTDRKECLFDEKPVQQAG